MPNVESPERSEGQFQDVTLDLSLVATWLRSFAAGTMPPDIRANVKYAAEQVEKADSALSASEKRVEELTGDAERAAFFARVAARYANWRIRSKVYGESDDPQG